MAKTIANFLVGIGLDTKDFEKGSRKVDTNLSGFRSKAGAAGAAIAGAFAAVGAVAISAGDKADKFALAVARFDTSRRFVYNLGNAFRLMGGDASEAIDAIGRAESVLDALKKGDASAIESAALSRVNVDALQRAKDGEDLLKRLSDIMPNLQKWQQRSLQETFGLSNAALATLSGGRDKFEDLITQVDKHADNLDAAAEAGRAFNEQMAKLGITFDGLGQIVAKYVLPSFTDMLKSANEFLEQNKPKFEAAAKYAGDNAGAVATIGAGATAAAGGAIAGAALKKLGMTTLARVATGATVGGAVGAAAGGASLLYDLKSSDIKEMTGYDVSKYYRSPSETFSAIGDWWSNRNKKPAATTDKWWEQNAVGTGDAAASSPSVEAAKRTSMNAPAKPQQAAEPARITIDNVLTLNGRELAKYIKEVSAEDRAAAQESIQSTVSR